MSSTEFPGDHWADNIPYITMQQEYHDISKMQACETAIKMTWMSDIDIYDAMDNITKFLIAQGYHPDSIMRAMYHCADERYEENKSAAKHMEEKHKSEKKEWGNQEL